MFVATARITLAIVETGASRTRRQLVQKLVGKVRSRFNVSIAEVGSGEVCSRVTFGLAAVGNEPAFARKSLECVLDFIEELYLAPIASRVVEVLPLQDILDGSGAVESLGDLEAKLEGDLDASGWTPVEAPRRRETWPGVRTLADAEGLAEDEREATPWPPKSSRRGSRPGREMSEEDREKALEELRERMKRPKEPTTGEPD